MLIQKLKGSKPFALISGLNVIESYDAMRRTAESLALITSDQNVEFVFKASFDKANRSNEGAFRGPGLHKGLDHLMRLKQEMKTLAIVTDVHEPDQCALVKAAGLDMIQIPAFLCRQTDLIYSAADTGLPVLIKKGQFASVDVIKAAVSKAESRSNYAGSIICERGTSFGPENLVVDFRNLITMRGTSALVALDATHAAQRPAARTRDGKGSDGDIFAVDAIARAGAAIGVDCMFLEVHENPSSAPVDSKVQLNLQEFRPFLQNLIRIANASRG